jgi:hypothetical protein
VECESRALNLSLQAWSKLLKKTTHPQPRYDVLIGFNYGKDNKRHEAGEKNVALPETVAQNLLSHIPPAVSLSASPKSSPEGVN